ncbi:MAG TPA: AarF/ABC1/UbiB kinase family protein, partial [Myxococcaceae bacterium]|nr:AarF/ABC1/UbiB kinase family protein [Myxococcaceae bacterium]
LDALVKLVSSVGELKGIAMKAGQLLSYVDLPLPPQLQGALSVLQTQSPAMPFSRVSEIVSGELGIAAGPILADMDRTPVSAASIGQVHRARLPDGHMVAVKVRYPEIDQAMNADFRPAAVGGRIAAIVYPGATIEPMIRELRARFLEECDYLHEARMQTRFWELFREHPTIIVPKVYPRFSTGRVLATEWIEGLDFESFLANSPSQSARDRVGECLLEFYVGTLYRHGLYNCDPHPGNYLFLSDGRVAMLDYGCTREFDRALVRDLAALTRSVQLDDRSELEASFRKLGLLGSRSDFATARSLMRSFYGPMLRDERCRMTSGDTRSLGQLFQSKKDLMKLTVPGEFLFLFRIRFGLMSVLARLGAQANWLQLERRFAMEAR